MELASELVTQFAKMIKDESKPASEVGVMVEGTAKSYDNKIYVQLDGSDQLTPVISSTAGMKDGDRVTVMIKDHMAKVTGNTSSPSAGSSDLNDVKDDVADQISEFEIIVADKVDTETLNAQIARIDTLVSQNVTITDTLTAATAEIENLKADNVEVTGKLEAAEAEIDDLTVNMLTVEVADMKYALITDLNAVNADIRNLIADYGSFKQLSTETLEAITANIENLDTDYANVDFANIGDAAIENLFAKSGMIEDLVVSSGTVTGTLVGVTILGDSIEANTLKADRLVLQGEDGLYYELNVNAEKVSAQQTEYNALNGTIIIAKSITADKVDVTDLVAFDATIGGYHITDSELYSGVKESAVNTTRGVYMNDQGEFAAGDTNNYIRLYEDEDGQYKLELSASSLLLSNTQTDIVQAIEEANTAADEATNAVNNINTVATDNAEAILKIQNSIATLVTDENGASLMEQTTNGWKFNMGPIDSKIEEALEQIGSVSSQAGDAADIANQAKDLANDISQKTAYITMTQDDTGAPCIELGKADNPFKVRITNTSIDFMEGSQKIAYVTNRSLYIQSSVVTDEMKVGDDTGGFIWKKRSNGNMGLRWEGTV